LRLLPWRDQDLAPSEVTDPLSRLPSLGERHHNAAPKPRCFVLRKAHGCAHRVSHPLDALLPPRPAGLVPSRSRVWGSPFEALLRGERRAGLSTRLHPHEVSRPLAFGLANESASQGPRLSRALLTHRSQPATFGYCTMRRCCCLHGLLSLRGMLGLVRRAERPVPLSRFADLPLLIVLAHGQ
jgi:hypothetical protein